MSDKDYLLTLLINARSNQEVYMKNQWQVAYWTFALYAALIYVYKEIAIYRYGFMIVILILVSVSIFLICKLQTSIENERKMVEMIHAKFPFTLWKDAHNVPKETRFLKQRLQKLHVKEVLIVSVIVGALLSSFVMKKTETLEHRMTALEEKIITRTK